MKVCSVCRRHYDDSVPLCIESAHPALVKTHHDDLPAIGGYRIHSLIRSGTGGSVYRAIQTDSGQSCLMRILPTPEASTQFFGEAKLAAGLIHPNVVETYETGTSDTGALFVVTEDADGKTLREFLVELGTPDLVTSIAVIRQAAEALHAMHLNGMTHGAVSPENIILTKDHEQKLLVRIQNPDFGSVIERSVISNKFVIDSALGSIRYFAPEQCSGDPRSAKTDVYSLGIVFYEMLAGRPPFDAAKAAVLIEKHRRQMPPEIRIENFSLRMLVTHAVMESLQKRPSARQSSAGLLARQLRHMEQLVSHTSTPPPASALAAIPSAPSHYVELPFQSILSPVVVAPAPSVELLELAQNGPSESVEMPTPVEASGVDHAEAEQPTVAMATEPAASVIETIAAHTVSESAAIYAAPWKPFQSHLKEWKEKLNQFVALFAIPGPEYASTPESDAAVTDFAAESPMLVELSTASSAASFAPVEVRVIEPRKNEVLQTEDDIPTVALVDEVLAKEPVVEQLPMTEPVIEEVLAKELVIESVMAKEPFIGEILANEPVIDQVFAKDAMIEQVAARVAELEQAFAVLGKKPPEVQPAIEEVKILLPPEVKALPVVPKRRLPISTTIVETYSDVEEITQVRAPRSQPIRIDLEKATYVRPHRQVPRRPARPATEASFVPTILGGRQGREMPEVVSPDSMFSSYYGKPRTSLTRRYRSFTIVGGIITVTAFLLFGNDSITRYFQSWSSADSMTMSTRNGNDSAVSVSPGRVSKAKAKSSAENGSSPNRDLIRRTVATTQAGEKSASKEQGGASTSATDKASLAGKSKSKPEKPGSETRPRIVRSDRQ